MTYATGAWGIEAKKRSKKRLVYFREYSKTRRLKLGRKPGIGRIGEEFFLQTFSGSVWTGKPYDIDWKKLKIDIKTSLPRKLYNRERWKFCLERQKGIVDYFFLVCLNPDRTIADLYFIPETLPVKNVSILTNGKSKYHKYRVSIDSFIDTF
jgi:hypothetical protein